MLLPAMVLAVSTGGAAAEVPLDGGTWSFSWVIRSKSCDVAGCRTDVAPIRTTETRAFRRGGLPTPGPIAPCTACDLGGLAGLVSYVADPMEPRRYRLTLHDRAAVVAVFREILPGFELRRWSSNVTLSADGRTSRQRDVLRYAYDADGVRELFRVTFVVRGARR